MKTYNQEISIEMSKMINKSISEKTIQHIFFLNHVLPAKESTLIYKLNTGAT